MKRTEHIRTAIAVLLLSVVLPMTLVLPFHHHETATPAYTLLNMSAGTDLVIKGKKRASIYLLADNLLDSVWQSHLSRLKEVGIYNMGRNITVKLIVPIP